MRSRKAHKSKLTENLSPLRQPQAIIGEGIISMNNNKGDQMIGEGLASANSGCDDLARADFMGAVKAIHFSEESENDF